MTSKTAFNTGVLSREEIRYLLNATPPLVDGMIDIEEQVQPNGVDLTLDAIESFTGPGTLTIDNARRHLPGTTPFGFDQGEQIYLPPGSYQVRFNETLHLPADCMAYTRPRSSLLRSGVALHTAVWDAGYNGRGVALLVVYNEHGFRIEHNARIAQIVFHRLSVATSEGYSGMYSGEGSTGP